mgnify:FL=1
MIVPLPPALPGVDVTVARVETLRPDCPVALMGGGAMTGHLEELEGTAPAILTTTAGVPVAVQAAGQIYIGGWGDDAALDRLVAHAADHVGLARLSLPDGLRVRDTATERFWFNYNAHPVDGPDGPIPAAGVLRQSK